MPEIGLSATDRILRHAGASRVTADAAGELRVLAEELCLKIAKKAVDLAKHRGHTTVTDQDVRQAYRLLFQF